MIHPKLSGKCGFPQNFRTKKISEITVFYTVPVHNGFLCYSIKGGGEGAGGINISKYPNDSYLTRFSLGFDVFCVSAFHD